MIHPSVIVKKGYMENNNKHMNRGRIDKMVIVYSTRPPVDPPREGDRRMIKGVMHIRRQIMVRPFGQGDSRVGLSNRGRPVFEWVTEEQYKKGYE